MSSMRSTKTVPRIRHGSDVSREGVQRGILPIIEGTTVNTRYELIRTVLTFCLSRRRRSCDEAIGFDS